MHSLTRCLPPAVTSEACKTFDGMVVTTALKILQIDAKQMTPVAYELLSLPLSLGGFGLSSLESVAPAAFLSSVASSAKFLGSVPRRVPVELGYLVHAIQQLGLEDDKLPSPDAFVERYAQVNTAKLQKEVTEILVKRRLGALMEGASEELRAHITSHSQRGSSLWLSAVPHRPEFVVFNDAFRVAARIRLRLPPSSNPPTVCSCGFPSPTCDHFLACVKFRRRTVTRRHDSVALRLHNFLWDGGNMRFLVFGKQFLTFGILNFLEIFSLGQLGQSRC